MYSRRTRKEQLVVDKQRESGRVEQLIADALDKLAHYLDENRMIQLESSVHTTSINCYVTKFKKWFYILKSRTDYFGKLSSLQFLMSANHNPEDFDKVYELLANEASRATFDWYVQYRTAYAFIGEEAYELFPPQITRKVWNDIKRTISKIGNNIYQIDDFTIECSVGELIGSFIVQQYKYKNIVEPRADDIVFDIGAYVGDTALWFSKTVGSQGEVYAFEPEPNNFAKLKTNIERNNITNVIPLQMALSETEGRTQIVGRGGVTAITQRGTNTTIEATTIDKFVKVNKVPKVDYIKMDVEGHELKVLKGAAETIQTYKPRLALSVYHRGDDLVELPKFLLALNPNYRFYLRHCTPIWADTVLYAISVDN